MRTGSSPPDTTPRRPSGHSDLPELLLKSSSGSAPARPCSGSIPVPGRGTWTASPRRPPSALRSVPHGALQRHPSQASGKDDERLGDLLHVGEDDERRQSDGHGGHVDERAP